MPSQSSTLLPREKLLIYGAEKLTDAELLALFLRTGTRNKPVVAYAEYLLRDTGGISQLLNLTYQELSAIKGLGEAKYTSLKALLELAKRYYLQTLSTHNVIRNTKQAEAFLLLQMKNLERETFACLFLDSGQRLLEYKELFYGTINQVTVHPREIAKHALSLNASFVILAHNHPSGNTQPSESDILLTQNINRALSPLDIELCDHFIVAHNRCQSMAQLGLMKS